MNKRNSIIAILLLIVIFLVNQALAPIYIEESVLTEDKINIKYNAYRSSKDTALFIVPGWFMTKDSKAFRSIAEDFAKYYDVYAIDLRGHGKSSGLYTFTTNEVKDIRAVIEKTRAERNYRRYLLLGFSLGGALVINYTAKYKDVDSVIAVSAPTSFDNIENHFWSKEAVIPTFKKFEFDRWISIRPSLLIKSKVNSIDVISEISPIPVYLIAGQNDKTVFPWHAFRLYHAAKEPKKVYVFQDTIHAEDIYLSSPQTFVNSCYNWYELGI
ncbi:alpha/beta fold hydrolase [bacterium]|nr:alpha/beta fold hydrolase [bacterium]